MLDGMPLGLQVLGYANGDASAFAIGLGSWLSLVARLDESLIPMAGAEDRALIETLFFPQEMGRPFVMPPGTPKEPVHTIRRAFDATMKDPAFLAEAEKSLFDVDPLNGEEMRNFRRSDASEARVQRAAECNVSGGAYRSIPKAM